MEATIIDTRVVNLDQSWHFQRVVVMKEGGRFRVRIKRNAYDFQSYAKVERWDGAQWHFVHGIPIEDCECRGVSYVQKGVTADHFSKDCASLLGLALAITGGV